VTTDLFSVRSVLFLPASNPRAIGHARESAADLVVLDLEDAVKAEDKDSARAAAVEAVAGSWPMPVAIRINVHTRETEFERHPPIDPSLDDCAAVAQSPADFVVVPKVQETGLIDAVAEATGKPVLAMIETPYSVMFLREIIAAQRLAGLIAGTNDLRAGLRVPIEKDRSAISASLQMIVLAARTAGIAVFDGVFNDLEDADGFAAECAEGRRLGFDGKSLVHPKQIEPCNRAFSPTEEEIGRARRLLDSYNGGAERFEGQMIERMHVAAAERLLQRAPGA
jgi:citrate lyase subunit beta/citryl-CoA lyase